MKRPLIAASLIATVAIGIVLGVILLSGQSPQFQPISDAASADFEYVIPLGTGDRIDAEENVTIIPSELEVRVGESIRIVNNDERGHIVGVFFVGPGETMSQKFTSAGTLSGGCTIHPSGKFTLRVFK